MKRFLIIGVICLSLFGSLVWAGDVAVFEAYRYRNITTATTTYVKEAPGILAGIVVNGGTMGSITVVDNTSTVVGSTVATIASPVAGQVIPFGVKCGVGIAIVTGAATDLTVVWQ